MKATRHTKRPVVKAAAEPATKAEAKTDVKADIKAKFEEVIEQAKAKSQDNRLAMLGLIANARKARDDRRADLIEAGRAYEPELQAKMDELKSKFKLPEGKGFKFELGSLGKKADKGQPSKLQTVLNERLAESFARMGLPTRKDFDALNKKVDKLIELQRA